MVRSMERQRQTIEVDGLRIRYFEEGAGPDVVMLHGASLGSSAEAFDGVITPLAESGYRVLAFDQPGYGESDNPEDYTLAYRTEFVTKLMDAWRVERAFLVGHSQAGGIAFQVTARRPERVAGVVVVCTGSLLPPAEANSAPGPAAPAREDTPSRDPTPEATLKLMQADLFHKELATPEAVERRHRLSVGKNVAAAAGRSAARESGQSPAELWAAFEAAGVPLLLLYGDHDRANAGERAAALQQHRPDLRVVVAKDAAHMLMWDAPDTFVTEVRAFLARAAGQDD